MGQKLVDIEDPPQIKRKKKSLKGGRLMYKTGEKPGKGEYVCLTCGQVVRLDDNSDTLPPCPKCEATLYYKR